MRLRYKSKLTGICGGIELLISCGFQAVVLTAENPSPSPIPIPLSNTVDKIQHDVDFFASSEGSAVERGLFAILHPHSEWTLTLVMEEPQIDNLLPPAPISFLNSTKPAKPVTSIPGE